jgi:K+ transporter
MYASIPINDDNIIGGISALLWTIMLVVSLKYVTVVMRVHNRGEGGVMALTALASQSTQQTTSAWWKVAVLMLGKKYSGYTLLICLFGVIAQVFWARPSSTLTLSSRLP